MNDEGVNHFQQDVQRGLKANSLHSSTALFLIAIKHNVGKSIGYKFFFKGVSSHIDKKKRLGKG